MSENNQTESKPGRGGARKGAGRKAGSATKRTRAIADAASVGLSPLEYMLEVMRSEPPECDDVRVMLSHVAMKFEAAKAAAPYIHPRLATIAHTGEGGGAIKHSIRVRFG